MLGGVINAVKDYLFPFYCVQCNKEGEWWCKDCRKDQVKIINRAEGKLEILTALFKYDENNNVEKLIHNFKYNYVSEIENLWRDLIIEAQPRLASGSVIMPIPLWPKRMRERGYNQAEIIAKILSGYSGLPIDSVSLKRIKQTAQQAKLNLEQRKINVSGAFKYYSKKQIESVILVDDVFTTGATMNECAEELIKGGVKHVAGFVLAHG